MKKAVLGNVVPGGIRDLLSLRGGAGKGLNDGIDLFRMRRPFPLKTPSGRFFVNDFQRPVRERRAGKDEAKEG